MWTRPSLQPRAIMPPEGDISPHWTCKEVANSPSGCKPGIAYIRKVPGASAVMRCFPSRRNRHARTSSNCVADATSLPVTRSHSLTRPSRDPEAAQRLSGEMPPDKMRSLWPVRVDISRARLKSQVRRVLSWDQETSMRPSGLNRQPATMSVWPVSVRPSRSRAAFHKMSDRSQEAVASKRPSTAKTIADSGRVWARKVEICSCVSASQRASIPSSVPDNHCLPSGEIAQVETGLVLTWNPVTWAPVVASQRRR